MELKGKTFDINNDNKKVINTDGVFAYFEDGSRIKKDLLVTKYIEIMDPTSFFTQNASTFNIAKEIINLESSKITEHIEIIPEKSNIVQPEQVIKIDNAVLGINNSSSPKNDDFFSKIKRNNTISIDFSIDEKFPDLSFVRMMNDNYETSIIDHFAKEIVEKLVYDPSSLLKSITEKLNDIVYGEEKNLDKTKKTTKKKNGPKPE